MCIAYPYLPIFTYVLRNQSILSETVTLPVQLPPSCAYSESHAAGDLRGAAHAQHHGPDACGRPGVTSQESTLQAAHHMRCLIQ